MIDTVRFKIRINELQIKNLKKYFYENSKKQGSKQIYKVYNGFIDLPSFDSKINFFVEKNTEYLYLEYSVPKYTFGHNIYHANYDHMYNSMIEIHKLIEKYIHDFDHPDNWEIQRIDYCYNYDMIDDKVSLLVLSALQNIDVARKKKYIYDTSLMYKGKTFSSKFYMKGKEFSRNDFKRIYKHDKNLALRLELIAKRLLRYEITCRKTYLSRLLDKKRIKYNDIIQLDPRQVINLNIQAITRYIDLDFSRKLTNKQLLEKHFSKTKSIRLLHFFEDYYSNDLSRKKALQEQYSRQTIYRNKKDIKKAGLSPKNKHKIPLKVDFML